MGITIAAAGRFGIGLFAQAAEELMEQFPTKKFSNWGFVYCYGNRLEALKSDRDASDRLKFDKLTDVKTDMAVLHLNELETENSIFAGHEQPFLWGRGTKAWGFCHQGVIRQPKRLAVGNRVLDGPNPSKRYFFHILEELNIDDPIGSVVRIQSAIAEEPELSFFLMDAELLIVSLWCGTIEGKCGSDLWSGQDELLRILTPSLLHCFPDVQWKQIPNHSVLAITRLRRAIA